jgi:hypothetical protein
MATASKEMAADSGITLQKRVLSTPEVLAQSVANMAPSAADRRVLRGPVRHQDQLGRSTVIPNHIFAALTWPWWTFPYVFLAWTALGLIAYLYIRMRKPEVIHAAGTWGDATDPNAAAEEAAATTAS